MMRRTGLLLVLILLAAGCGDDAGTTTTPTAPATVAEQTTGTTATTTTTPAGPTSCTRDDVDGCGVFGFVLPEPLPLDAALEAVAGLPGVPIAVYRTDRVCVLDIDMMPGPEDERVTSAFAYVDARGIRDRRLTASNSGLAPPITGLHTSSDYWDQWEDEWDQAQGPGVLIQAVAVYLPETVAAGAAGFTAMVPIPSRRTDSTDPSYPGELLLESKRFPAGHLTEPEPLDCG